MVFDDIEILKQQYTDKFVVVNIEGRPELRRFAGRTGTVITVNMSGRALVEFDGREDRGRYDIDLDYLKVIDAPLPKPEGKAEKPAKKAAEKPAAAAKPAAAEKPAAAKPAAPAAPAAAGKPAAMSVADIMAAA